MTKLDTETLADLKRSGLDRNAAVRMRIRSVSSDELHHLYCVACKTINISPPKSLGGAYGYEIPYLGLDGKPAGFSRFRLFGEYVPKGEKRAIKYLQLPGTKPKFYFPPFCNWQVIANDPTIGIYVVEGEKKAAALARQGSPTIGLGGIWSWRTRGEDNTSDLIPDFNLLNWKARKTMIVFDADV